jgi:hypothetical protein
MALKLGFQSEKQGFVLSGNSAPILELRAPSCCLTRCLTRRSTRLNCIEALKIEVDGDFGGCPNVGLFDVFFSTRSSNEEGCKGDQARRRDL